MSETTKRPRGRPPGIKLPEEHRLKIKVANILTALERHVSGELDMSSTQVQAAGILLKKVLPDLAHSTLAGDQDQPVTVQRIVTGVVRHTDIAVQNDAAPNYVADAPDSEHDPKVAVRH